MNQLEHIMEKVCDCCHWPYVCGEEELEERCEECPVEAAIKRMIERAGG